MLKTMRAIHAYPVLIWAAAALFVAALIFAGHSLILFIEMAFEMQRLAAEAMLTHPAVLAILLIYIILLSIPFMPGAELGVMLLLVFGGQIAGHVYLATVLALLLSFGIGRLVPQERLIAGLLHFGLKRAAGMLKTGGAPAATDDTAPKSRWHRWADRIMRHRCIALAVLFNLPGNTVLGGGGGIAMAAGASRIVTPKAFVATAILGVAPVPLAVAVASYLGA